MRKIMVGLVVLGFNVAVIVFLSVLYNIWEPLGIGATLLLAYGIGSNENED